MRLFFIIDEFPFFLPQYLDGVIEEVKKEHKVVGITPLITPKGHKTLYTYIKSQMFSLGLEGLVKLAVEAMKLKVKKAQFDMGLSKNPASISQVAKKHRLKTVKTSNVNDKKYLAKLKKLDIDIVVSSGSQIFKEELLSLPKIACINRHSAYLPSYGGLFPVFYAMINNEEFTGATVHRMVSGIDKGSIVAQSRVRIEKDDSLFSLYRKTYEESVNVTADAIKKLDKNRRFLVKPEVSESYFSFPDNSHWEKFWKKRKKII